jgi:hypothetical protein
MPSSPTQPQNPSNGRQGMSDQLVVQVPARSQVPIGEKPASRNYGDTNAFLSLGLFVTVLLLFLAKYLKGRKKNLSLVQLVQVGNQTSCSKCRFFNQNPYLQCAVHPENFDSIDAKDCPDFWAVDQDEFLKK